MLLIQNFDIFLNETGITVSGQDVNLRFPISTAEQRQIFGAIWHEPIQRVQVWGVLHTPDGDVNSGVRYENNCLCSLSVCKNTTHEQMRCKA